jgi:unsaturated rhamnogalacturonyl hydrolase
MVKEDGTILNYGYINGRRNVDMINAGKILFDVYEQTGNPKYKKAMDLLYNAMVDHPRNSLGGFWHKEVYPWQITKYHTKILKR